MNVHERFKKIDALDKNEKRKILVKNSTANNDMWDKLGVQYPECDGEALEMVDHPTHYGGKGDNYEAINVIEAWELDFHCGSVVKYIARHKKKGHPRQDIEKAIWYLQRYLDECLDER
jgi:hypothetical protein